MLAGEVDPAFGRDDRVVEQCLLARVEQRERATGVLVVVPHLRRAHLELADRLGVDAGDVFERLHDPVVRRQRAPALRILAPGVARQHHAAAGVATVVGVVHVAHGEIGDGATADDAVVLFPEPAPELQEHLGRGVVVELADRALLHAREGVSTSTCRRTRRHRPVAMSSRRLTRSTIRGVAPCPTRQDQASASPRSTTGAPSGASHTGFGSRSMPCSARSAKYASLSTGTGRTSSP